MDKHAARICLCCKELFVPNPHAPYARYCSQPACRKASKRASQARWLNKPENRNHFCGECHVKRVQDWRKQHPGYWRQFQRKRQPDALQETVQHTFWKMHGMGQAIIMGMRSVGAVKG